jgi:hypothetical protein
MPDMKHTVTDCDCVTHAAVHITGRLTCPADTLAYATADDTLFTQVLCQSGIRGGYVEKRAETQTSNWLASSFARTPSS